MLSGGARGGATVLTMLRTKAVAVLLGPEGVGLLGLLTAVQEIGAQAADGGLSHSTVRRVAQARSDGDPQALGHLRRAVMWAVWGLAVAVALIFWMLREPIAISVGGGAQSAEAFGLVGSGIACMMIWRAEQAVLAGYHKVRVLAWLGLAGAAASAGAGLLAILLMGAQGVVWAVIAGPVAGVLLGAYTLGRLHTDRVAISLRCMWTEWRGLFGIGAGLMLSALCVLAAPFVVRVWLSHNEGLEAAGLYHAGLIIAMHAAALLLAGAGADYYPRISAMIGDPPKAAASAHAQVDLHLAVGGPALLALIALAPWMVPLLFSAAFADAVALAQVLLIGTVFRLTVVPIELCLTAQGRTGLILGLQVAHQGVALVCAVAAFKILGLWGLGLGFAAGQVLHLMLVLWAVRRKAGISLSRRAVLVPTFGIAVAAALVAGIGSGDSIVGAIAGCAVAGLCAWSARLKRNSKHKAGSFAIKTNSSAQTSGSVHQG